MKAASAKGRKYRVERVIGRGSFGAAYLVRSQANSRLYVMKRLDFEQMGEKDRTEALNECDILLKLREHPNIIRVHEHFMEKGCLCIMMDYADGGDLAQRIEAQAASRSPFQEEQVIDWFVQVSAALAPRAGARLVDGWRPPPVATGMPRAQARARPSGPPPRPQAAEHLPNAQEPRAARRLWHLEGAAQHDVGREHVRRHAAVPGTGAVRGQAVQ